MATDKEIRPGDLPERVQRARTRPRLTAPAHQSSLLSMEEVERRHILRVLHAVDGNKTIAAQILGLDRRTLYRRLERYGVAMDLETTTG